jgi:serine/threonine protein kinase
MYQFSSLEGLVRSGNTLQAIKQLIDLIESLNSEFLKDLSMLSSRFYANNNADKNNLQERNLTTMERDKITYTFLNILRDIKAEVESKIGFYKPATKNENEHEILHDFLYSVLAKKYEDLSLYAKGNTFLYFKAREIDSKLKVMIMVQRSADMNAIDKADITKIAQLKHRNLIQLLDANLKTFPSYIITEYVEGINLKELLCNIGFLPLHSTKRLLALIGEVMILLRQKKFPYASIRPSKVIIDQELEPEISPFDILMVDSNRRLLMSFIEDSHYFAPEILYNNDSHTTPTIIDKANQFCLAALGYEMITGSKLFDGTTISDILIDRDRFFKDENYRNKKFDNHRLIPRLVTIFKRMLQFNPKKRYEDLPTAMREIAKVRAPFLGDVDIIFNSYKRCLHDSDDFVTTFQQNLKKQNAIEGIKKALDNDSNEELYSKFYHDIHLVFDPQNTIEFLDKVTAFGASDISPVSEYKAFLDAFLETVKYCDPRWDSHKVVRKAWENVSSTLRIQLDSYVPKSEVQTNYTSSTNTDDILIASSDMNSQTILSPTVQDCDLSGVTIPDTPVSNGETIEKMITNEEVQFNHEKA